MDKLQVQIEALEQKRSRWLKAILIGFSIWYGFRIVDTYFLEKQSHPILLGIVILGFFVWLFFLVKLLSLVKEINSTKQINQILNDELVTLNRLKTWRMAFIAVVLTQAVILFLSLFVRELPGMFVAELSIFVAVAFSLGGFLYYNSESDA